jgi:ATP-binding cassette subfamily A (ABC1) protein 3
MGLCTQRDILYQYLTVMEHLLLLCGIKGIPINYLKLNHILSLTDLTSESHKLVKELSGGSMRKLSLSLSLIGDA